MDFTKKSMARSVAVQLFSREELAKPDRYGSTSCSLMCMICHHRQSKIMIPSGHIIAIDLTL